MDLLKGISHFTHSSLKFEREKVIYIDPFQIRGEPHDADLIFCTHDHFDHLSVPDIMKIIKPSTVIVTTKSSTKMFKKVDVKEVIGVEPNREYEAGGIGFETVPSYNVDKKFHKRKENFLGYIIILDGYRYYAAGDSDYIPEMNTIKADVVFLPVGGTYTCTAETAAQAANAIKPQIAVPIHFGSIIGTRTDAEAFISKLDEGIQGVILLK